MTPLISIHLGDKYYTIFFNVHVHVMRFEAIDE